jgi:hypothetical protein
METKPDYEYDYEYEERKKTESAGNLVYLWGSEVARHVCFIIPGEINVKTSGTIRITSGRPEK